MRTPSDIGDWLFLGIAFLAFCALVAALGPVHVDFGVRYVRAFVAFGSGIAAMAVTVILLARLGRQSGAAFATGWLLGMFLAAPLAVSLAMRLVP